MTEPHTECNPFIGKFQTLHEAIPFHQIRLEDYEPAIRDGIREAEEEISAITQNPETPTFDNTIVALENSGELLDRVTSVLFNIHHVNTSDRLDELVRKLSPILSEHANDILLNEALFQRIKYVYDHRPAGLTGEENLLLLHTYENFVRNGAELGEDGKEKRRELSKELSRLTLQFSQNLLKDTNDYTLHITKEKYLQGLPDSLREQAAQAAKDRQTDGWIFTLQAPSYVPFMTYADNRSLREQMYLAYNTRCTHSNANNNFDLVKRIVNLRREMAQLVGYPCHADFVMKRRMAQNTKNVYDLLNQLIEKYREPALREVGRVTQYAQKMAGTAFQLKPWDWAYYAHKLQLEKYRIDDEMLRPYFELSKVRKGIFQLATRLYGITFRENPNIPVYHPDVKAYEVFDTDGTFLALLYTDFYPRAEKQGGAWMTNYREQKICPDGTRQCPIVAIATNFTKPTDMRPSLLTFSEVETFLHEFGHALHGIFANTCFRSLSGTNVYWDFVELPSQLMENFAVETEFLQTFAFHYQTEEPIPADLVNRIINSRNYNAAYACMRQVSFGLLDMAYYTLEKPFDDEIIPFEKESWKQTILLPQLSDTCMSTQFSHIMSGGYSAGYYSYKWAEVLDADAFAVFKETGIFSQETASRFRQYILSKGGTENPMDLYIRFRGRKPTIDALLQRNGIA